MHGLLTPHADSLIVSSVSEQVNSANPDLMVHSLNMESLTDDETDSLKIFHYTEWAQYGKQEYLQSLRAS